MHKKYAFVLLLLLCGLYHGVDAMRFDALFKDDRICATTTLRKDTKEFIDSMASCTYPELLYVIPSAVLVGNKPVKVLQYQDDLDIFRNPEKPECSLKDRTNGIALDRIDKTFVLKCYEKLKQESVIREAVGSYVGAALKAPIHKVRIIPASIDFVGKKFCLPEPCMATLHTYVPGKEISLLNKEKQKEITSWLNVKKLHIRGGLLNEDAFQAATNSTEICDIMILDICADNADRHNGNLRFFNGHFYAYDMDESFNSEIGETVACATRGFLEYFLPKKVLVKREKKMLLRVQRGLKRFLGTFPYNMLYNLWMEKAAQAEYSYSNNDKKNLKKQFVMHKKDIKNLIQVIETFLK